MRAPLLTAALVATLMLAAVPARAPAATSAAACPAPLQTGPCASAVDCRLNGACDAGKCRCDRGWGGQYCQLLQLGPGSTAYGTLGTTSAWGGGPPYWSAETASYHLFATELAAHCGMAVWGRMSQAVHAVSKTLLGPYTRVATALPTDTHNVYHQYSSADRTHVIYHIGTSENPPSCNPYLKCTNGSTPGAHSLTPPANWTKPTCPDTSAAPRMHWSKSVDGPWMMAPLRLATIPWLASHGSHNGGTSHQTSNPAPLILDNGTVLLMARSANQMVINGTKQHYPEVWLFRADSWNGMRHCQSTYDASATPPAPIACSFRSLILRHDSNASLHVIVAACVQEPTSSFRGTARTALSVSAASVNTACRVRLQHLLLYH